MTTLYASRIGIQTIRRLSNPICRLSRIPLPCRNQSSLSNLVNKDSLPRILQPSMWDSIIPRSFRRKTREIFTERQKRPTNPASYFIWIYLLIGSQAIRIIAVKNDHATFSRKAELQIDKLREVIQKLQAGEEVDVEKVLGTGVPEEEDAWEQALKEIENEERIWTQSRAKKREQREAHERQLQAEEQERKDASPVNMQVDTGERATVSNTPFTSPRFF